MGEGIKAEEAEETTTPDAFYIKLGKKKGCWCIGIVKNGKQYKIELPISEFLKLKSFVGKMSIQAKRKGFF